ncbi:MAG: DUF5320 domain-containing protein [Terracidiphilus sp.]
MPFGDQTGPLGQGSMTGRGRGYCAGNAGPGRFESAPGSGMGRGGRGGRGRCNRFRAAGTNVRETPVAASSAPADRPQEVAALRSTIDELRSSLNEIRKRVEELSSASKTE